MALSSVAVPAAPLSVSSELLLGGRTAVVRPVGDLEASTAAVLRERLVALDEAAVAAIVVDLSGVAFIDSFGLGVLVGALRRCQARGASFVVAAPRPQVADVLRVSHLAAALGLAAA